MTLDDEERLARIEQMANAATEGPWTGWAGGVHHLCDPDPDKGDGSTDVWFPRVPTLFGKDRRDETKANRDFCIAARMDVPWLIEQLREAQAARRRPTWLCAECSAQWDAAEAAKENR